MADMLVSALVPIVLQKSADLQVQGIADMWGIADLCEKLHDKLLAVKAVLTDAEEKGDAKPSVKSWLVEVKSAAYDADDILDEFRYEELRRDAVRRGHKVGNVSGFFSLENPILFRFKMSRKFKKVVGRFDELVTEMIRFQFDQGRRGRQVPFIDRVETISYVNESEVVGRGDDNENLVKLLTEVRPTENLTVLPVVGMGGLGKTALAQLVYNDPRIKEHFKLLVWICVSEEFHVASLVQLIINTIIQKACGVPRGNMELLQRRLHEEIRKTRYLLIMDDVWNENVDEWEQLAALLNCGDLGSAVVVTTRSPTVATIMGTVEPYNLRCLGEEDSWSLFKRRAFSKGVKEHPQLVGIGRKLVKNCGGLPFEIKTLGSLMSNKDEVHQWLAVLEESTTWENKHANNNDELVSEMERFKFVQGRQGHVDGRDRSSHSYVIESQVEGRGDDKENIVKLLTEVRPTENLIVLPIVGMGGLGKTTLAQLAYNDPRIKEHFKLLVWVYVSEECHVASLVKLIISTIIQQDCEVPFYMELLQRRLREEIGKQRYLLVLDDVWNENVDEWEQLAALLNCGDLGSAVVVTTRSPTVATIMGTVEPYNLRCLGEEDSWSLFKRRAFSKGVKEHPQLVGIGRKLVKNCGGLPFEIKTLGSLMSNKDEVRQWLAVLEESTTWENKHANNNDELVSEMERFKFVQGRQGRVDGRDRSSHSYVNESEVVGRGDDNENLVKLLTEVRPTENLTVLPVVGMGGLGKTALAQLVYNDPRIKEHFKLLVWICVSEEFHVASLVKLIISTIIQQDCKVPFHNMELLQRRLREEIGKQRYLLVLDDVWNENVDKWEQLAALLNCGDLGSAVVVTTRNNRVAAIMGTVEAYNLRCLGEEDSWSLFKNSSKGVKEHPQLVGIGRKLVKNCEGLPFAIKTLGSLMSYKNEVREWLAVLEQNMTWKDKHANDDNGVLSVLRLSYDHLPSYMKQCFAFCAVFPKDHVMEKEKLVQYWMAHGFIPSDGLGDLEMMGSDIFNELVWRSFFQDVKEVFHYKHTSIGYRSRTTCKMNDLMHNLAQSVMRDECLSLLEPLQINNNLQRNVRHILLREFPKDINDVIQDYRAARTLILAGPSFVKKIGFVKSNFLRVFELSRCFLNDKMITPRKMKHLRYLHLSNLTARAIPEAITTLYLLQTLRLFNCFLLSELPEGIRYMMSLRHLHIEGCRLKCTPPGLGELNYLQTLTYYIVGAGVGNKIGELKNLNLGGRLEVYNLGEVGNAREAREVNMASKQNLDHLALCWGMLNNFVEEVRSNGSETNVVDPFEVLDALKPCNKLKVLRIKQYRGDKFPVWMIEYQMLENLVELYIDESRRCTNVPPLHCLPLLQILHIKFMDNLRYLCYGAFMSAECGDDAQITFPALKSFILEEMPNLDCWCEGDVAEKTALIFPVLSKLSIINCPKLSAMPVIPLLEEMKIEGNKTLSSLATGITNVRSLTLQRRGGRENNADETLF